MKKIRLMPFFDDRGSLFEEIRNTLPKLNRSHNIDLRPLVLLFFVFHLLPLYEWFYCQSDHLSISGAIAPSWPTRSYLILLLVNFTWFMLTLKKYVVPCVNGGFDPTRQSEQKKMIDQVVHDVRSPVAAMSMVIEYDLEDVNDEVKTLLQKQVERIQNITNDLSRKNKEISASQLKKHFLPSLIEEIIKEKQISLKLRSDICLEYSYREDLCQDSYAKVDPTEFKRVLSNMINNAIDAKAQGDLQISVRIEKERRWFKDYIKVVIQDNGKGIPKAVLSKIFQERYSYGKEGMKESGSGLGLYHAKKSIENWKGHIQVSSQEGDGAKFSLILPKA